MVGVVEILTLLMAAAAVVAQDILTLEIRAGLRDVHGKVAMVVAVAKTTVVEAGRADKVEPPVIADLPVSERLADVGKVLTGAVVAVVVAEDGHRVLAIEPEVLVAAEEVIALVLRALEIPEVQQTQQRLTV